MNDGVLIKKQKLTEGFIQDFTWPVDSFTTQYQTCLLLLAHGIPGLPYDVVYMIVRKYVYIKPLRINTIGAYVQTISDRGECLSWCEHEILDLPIQMVTLGGGPPRQLYQRWTHEQIVAWFEKHQFSVPEHFLTKDVKGRLPQY
jgi:hypothetical protein